MKGLTLAQLLNNNMLNCHIPEKQHPFINLITKHNQAQDSGKNNVLLLSI